MTNGKDECNCIANKYKENHHNHKRRKGVAARIGNGQNEFFRSSSNSRGCSGFEDHLSVAVPALSVVRQQMAVHTLAVLCIPHGTDEFNFSFVSVLLSRISTVVATPKCLKTGRPVAPLLMRTFHSVSSM